MAALTNYAKYGKDSRMTDIVSKERLENIDVKELTQKVNNFTKQPYEIFFYGKNFSNFLKYQKPFVEKETLKVPAKKVYPEPATSGKVYFTNYDMVQTEMSKVAKGNDVNIKNNGKINVFNEYFGRGLSSIVFQEIRESKSLAYTAYVSYAPSNELKHPDYVTTYIGTQANKLPLAVAAMDELMAELPQIPTQFANAKNAALKQIASSRINRTNIYFNTLALKKLGVDYDIRKDLYSEIQGLTLPQLTSFYNAEVKPLKYNTAIIGKKENLDMDAMKKLGEFTEVTLEEIFGY